MKMKRNEIIIVLVAFLVGVFLTMAFTSDSDDNKNVVEPNEETEVLEGEAMEKEDDEVEAAGVVTPQAAPVVNTTPTPAPRVSSCTPNISGVKDDAFKAIRLDWSTCPSDDFQFYKILKSSTTASLSYPGSPVMVSSSDKNLANHIDKTVARETTYHYRACVIERLGKTSCGNTISVKY